ncbi:hypothetical protein LTS03_011342 [Exophiala xenobiotica]|nr:hypothetical protein LTR92_011208 [Exophiala xenobiotica]KAK5284764.1 hypothetical protein LTR14_011513 [Exophiala xenobiotica]KAK5311942.1 hypothetical protein LTR93_011530 [Exophiala xenobiotica]KAK5358186.1 hypothetical protein LTS03_011342 [Exophiala xenobiotica]
MSLKPTFATVESEECTLHYWYQGSGPLLVLIPGGGGNGEIWNGITPHLASHYTVASFDRRGNLRSRLPKEKCQPLNVPQQARDVIAIIRAMGFEKAYIHGNSGGGLIALQLASTYSEFVEHVIAHESPTTAILADAPEKLDYNASVYDTWRKHGSAAAWKAFSTEMVGFSFDGRDIPHETGDYFFEYVYLYFGLYTPDLDRIRRNHVSIVVARGEGSREAFYARTVDRQAEIIGCSKLVFPGPHLAFATLPQEYGPTLLKAFEDLKAKSTL